jgi:transposase InsO family protein
LKAQIPVRTFGDWEGVRPGAVQADLVLHCGESAEGFYLTTLDAVDVATGWTECTIVWGKSQERVGGALHGVQRGLPFPLQAVHTDNGSEFLNAVVFPWCQRHAIALTRGRPYKKNDQAFVEQKNWSVIRRLVGYDRYSTKAADTAFERVYRLLRLWVNFFQPVRKLIGKERVGAKVVKRFDHAQTPYQRALAAGVLTEDQRPTLATTYARLNPVRLRAQLDAALDTLWALADRPGSPHPAAIDPTAAAS